MDELTARRRRKDARPGEIAEAALQVFAEKGFAAARMDDIAARAGVSKGAVYLYFATKEEVFHAVVRQSAAPNIERVREAAAKAAGPFSGFMDALVALFAETVRSSPLGAIAKMVIGESRNFPALARDWHEAVVSPMIGVLTAAIAAAQARGEVREGDPRLYAFQLVSPLVMSVIWRETFTPVGAAAFDVDELAAQHLKVLTRGMLTPQEAGA